MPPGFLPLAVLILVGEPILLLVVLPLELEKEELKLENFFIVCLMALVESLYEGNRLGDGAIWQPPPNTIDTE